MRGGRQVKFQTDGGMSVAVVTVEMFVFFRFPFWMQKHVMCRKEPASCKLRHSSTLCIVTVVVVVAVVSFAGNKRKGGAL